MGLFENSFPYPGPKSNVFFVGFSSCHFWKWPFKWPYWVYRYTMVYCNTPSSIWRFSEMGLPPNYLKFRRIFPWKCHEIFMNHPAIFRAIPMTYGVSSHDVRRPTKTRHRSPIGPWSPYKPSPVGSHPPETDVFMASVVFFWSDTRFFVWKNTNSQKKQRVNEYKIVSEWLLWTPSRIAISDDLKLLNVVVLFKMRVASVLHNAYHLP